MNRNQENLDPTLAKSKTNEVKIHHLNCATLCPTAGSLLFTSASDLVCHCLLIETNHHLVLVDSGFGMSDCQAPDERLGLSHRLIGAKLDPNETAISQIKKLGYQPQDVRDIIVTHLDLDHAGGISDFPWANVHLLNEEYNEAHKESSIFNGFSRYKKIQFEQHTNWKTHKEEGEDWFGFECIKPLPQTNDQILMIPLRGHTAGHTGIAVQTPKDWLFHVGDCYYSHLSLNTSGIKTSKQLTAFEALMAHDNSKRLHNVERLKQLKEDYRSNIEVFCSHDPFDFEKFKKM